MKKNIHPLRTEHREQKRKTRPPQGRCIFCLEKEHVAGANHDPMLTFDYVCQKHHDQLTEARRDADIGMEFERNRSRRVGLALKGVSVFMHRLADSMWHWGNTLEEEAEKDQYSG